MSIDRGMDKEDVAHIYNGISAIKKNEIMPFAATWMDPEMIILTEVSQTKTEKYMISYVEPKKRIHINLFIKQKQTYRLRKQTYGYQRGKVGRGG